MKEYTVIIGGLEHTLLLDEDEAKARGAQPVQAKAKAVQDKTRSTSTKDAG